jgi:superfamily II DNA or RNA helicase
MKYTKEKFIEKAREVHGDRYIYSKVIYKGSQKKVIIVCKEHGDFTVTPDNHIHKKSGCQICSGVLRYNTPTFIIKAKEIHGDKYIYDKVVFENVKKNVTIICREHGEFEVRPDSHINMRTGCSKCSGKSPYTIETFIEKARQIHGEKYIYDKVDFKNAKTKVVLICRKHGEFEIRASEHITSKRGCSKCAGKSSYTTQTFIEKARQIHGERYIYDKVHYINARHKVIIICRTHGEFRVAPTDHIKTETGCSICSRNKKYTTETFIEKARQIHGEKYIYDKVDFKNAKTKVVLICRKHGEFEIVPDHHINSRTGCTICNKGWDRLKIFDFLNTLENQDLLHMDSIELQTIINQGVLPDSLNVLVFSDESNRDNTIKALKEELQTESENIEREISNEITDDEITLNEFMMDDIDSSDIVSSNAIINDNKIQPISLIDNFADLHVLDKPIIASCDEETILFLINYKLRKLWNKVLNKEIDINKLKIEKGGLNFEKVKNIFFDEYENVSKYIPPIGYSFKYPLNLMQQLTVYRLLKYKRYGNWSGTGAGKTNSFIVSSRASNSRLTVVIGVNSTVRQLGRVILDVFPDSKVFYEYKRNEKFNPECYNYLILNYDKFQQGYSEELFQSLTDSNTIDFIAIDEVHNIKQRTEEQESIRRGTLKRLIGRAAERNPELYVLGMSATPVINNLQEAKSLLELISGKEYEDLKTNRTLTNAIEVFKQLTLNGLRYIPNYEISISELDSSSNTNLKIDGTHILDKILKIDNHNYLKAEQLLLEEKLKNIHTFLTKGVVIYSYFTTKMITPIVKYISSLGYSVGTFTGEESIELRGSYIDKFINGELDIIVGSRPIGTGVDGLQKVCNRIIVLSLPWTESEYTQLKGRIYRQGSLFKDVEIVIPQVVIQLNEKEWSWDIQRLNLIRNKKTLADAAVDGVIPSKVFPSPETLFSKSLEALNEWKNRLNEGGFYKIDRKDLVFPLRPEIVEQIGKKLGDFSEVNRKWSISSSRTTNNNLKENPEEWYYYHSLYAEKRTTWSEIPYVEIAKLIKRKDFVVADLGCGENLLKNELPKNKVLSFDHIAIDDSVTECDISNLPINSETVDVSILCLALMGTNYEDYITEAYRILKPMGFLFISEPKGKWTGKENELKSIIQKIGFNHPVIWYSGDFLYLKGEK